MKELPYYNIPPTPEEIRTTNIIARMIDGLGFRYRWATEGLTEKEMAFRPVDSSMDMSELMNHIYQLAYSANRRFGGSIEQDTSSKSLETLRGMTLSLYQDLSDRLKAMTDEDLQRMHQRSTHKYPFWNWLNGPIADALTHVGQVTSWRRISGNPQPKGVDVFLGTKSGD